MREVGLTSIPIHVGHNGTHSAISLGPVLLFNRSRLIKHVALEVAEQSLLLSFHMIHVLDQRIEHK